MNIQFDKILGVLREGNDGPNLDWRFAALIFGKAHRVTGGSTFSINSMGLHANGRICIVPTFTGQNSVTLDFTAAKAEYGLSTSVSGLPCGRLDVVIMADTPSTFTLNILRGKDSECTSFTGEVGYAVQAVFYYSDGTGNTIYFPSGTAQSFTKFMAVPFYGKRLWT